MIAWLAGVAWGGCVASGNNVLGLSAWRVEVVGDQVFRANDGIYLDADPAPLFVLGPDRVSVYGVRTSLTRHWREGFQTRRRPSATLDQETLAIRGRGPVAAIGRVDLEVGGAVFGGHVVAFEGSCTVEEALLAVVGSRALR